MSQKNQTSDAAQKGPGLRNTRYTTGDGSAGKGVPNHNPSGQPNSTDRAKPGAKN